MGLPVTAGEHTVRLYFAEVGTNQQAIGARKFDVSIEGALVLDDYDIFGEVGGFKGVVKTFTINADSNIDIDFGKVTQNPQIQAIEILRPSTGATNQAPTADAESRSVASSPPPSHAPSSR